MRKSRIWAIGLAAMLAWVNLAASQEKPKRPAPPRLAEGVKVLRDLQYVEGGHERNRLDLYLPEKAEGRLPARRCERSPRPASGPLPAESCENTATVDVKHPL